LNELGVRSPNRGGWRAYNETDLDTMRTKNQSERPKVKIFKFFGF
jgi:hypothetical protein